jgi:glycerol transport system ATP-binding protein
MQMSSPDERTRKSKFKGGVLGVRPRLPEPAPDAGPFVRAGQLPPRRALGDPDRASSVQPIRSAIRLDRRDPSGSPERMTIRLENVSVVSMGQSIISDVSLAVERGTMNVLLGPSLAGKTTLMRLLAGLDTPTSGRILVNGEDVTGKPVRQRSVAMVYQQFMNYPSLSVYENIASPLRVANVKNDEIERRVQAVARLLGLQSLLDRLPHQLSGGQQQRTAIARAIVKGAELVLLDEPLANLDYKLREELREELPSILKQSGAILVYATAEPLEALLLGGVTATLAKGRMVQCGPTAEVYAHPNHIESARVFSDPPLNEISAEKRDGSLRLAGDLTVPAVGAAENLPDAAYTLAFRGDRVTLGAPWPASVSLPGQVTVAEISGSETFVHVATALGTFVCVERGVSMRQPDQPVTLHIDAGRMFVFDRAGQPVVATRAS